MAIIGIGTDIIDIARIKKALLNQPEKFLHRIYTPYEIDCAQKISNDDKKIAYFAKRFAAKEAFAKALGTGMGAYAHWIEIEIKNTPQNAPTITLYATTKATLSQKSPTATIHLSLSDETTHATAFVVIEG